MDNKEDLNLNVKINYKIENENKSIEIKTKDSITLDELKNRIMKELIIPNTKDYLYLSYKDNKSSNYIIEEGKNISKYAIKREDNNDYYLDLELNTSDELHKFIQ